MISLMSGLQLQKQFDLVSLLSTQDTHILLSTQDTHILLSTQDTHNILDIL